jgi:hypothetical protein
MATTRIGTKHARDARDVQGQTAQRTQHSLQTAPRYSEARPLWGRRTTVTNAWHAAIAVKLRARPRPDQHPRFSCSAQIRAQHCRCPMPEQHSVTRIPRRSQSGPAAGLVVSLPCMPVVRLSEVRHMRHSAMQAPHPSSATNPFRRQSSLPLCSQLAEGRNEAIWTRAPAQDARTRGRAGPALAVTSRPEGHPLLTALGVPPRSAITVYLPSASPQPPHPHPHPHPQPPPCTSQPALPQPATLTRATAVTRDPTRKLRPNLGRLTQGSASSCGAPTGTATTASTAGAHGDSRLCDARHDRCSAPARPSFMPRPAVQRRARPLAQPTHPHRMICPTPAPTNCTAPCFGDKKRVNRGREWGWGTLTPVPCWTQYDDEFKCWYCVYCLHPFFI